MWRRLVVAHDRLMRMFQAELRAEFGLTVPQYDVLLRLAQQPGHEPVRMADLARVLLYSSGAATKVVDRLVTLDLVRRTADAGDGRAVRIMLTDTGAELIDRAMRAHGRSIARAIGPFASPEERRHVVAFLDRLAESQSR